MYTAKSLSLLLLILSINTTISAQTESKDYYYQLSEYNDAYSAGMVASRIIDGLGFRYYWGTADLNESDLKYRPSEGSRSLDETLDHILVLSAIINSTAKGERFLGISTSDLTYLQKRTRTLQFFQEASQLLQKSTDERLASLRVQIGSNTDLPFWNLINGPIADAINHVGQVITFRRTNGNPINPNISVLLGKVNEN